jgi:glyoxylase I family protein
VAIEMEGMCPLLQVFDMRTSLAFYRDTLGFEVIRTSSPGDDCDWCWLRREGMELMLNTQYERQSRPPERDPARARAHRDICLYMGCRKLDEAYAELRAHGIDAKPPVVRVYGMRQVYFHDPDGYELCLQWPVGSSG